VLEPKKLPIPQGNLDEIFKDPIDVVIEVLPDQILCTFGKPEKSKSTHSHSHSPSALGQELLAGEWNFAMWGEAISIAKELGDIPWETVAATLDSPEVLEGVKTGIWVLSHVYEAGFGAGIRDNGFFGVLQIETFTGDPPEVYAAYANAIKKLIDGDKGGRSALEAIGKKWPYSRAGRQARANSGGALIMSFATGILAAVSIPSFVKYQKEAEVVGP
jgi:hypothetical protein